MAVLQKKAVRYIEVLLWYFGDWTWWPQGVRTNDLIQPSFIKMKGSERYSLTVAPIIDTHFRHLAETYV